MNAEEAAHLCKLAKTISPSQPVDEFTPAAWALILEDVRFEDAREALKQLGGEQEWLHVSHIVKRVKRMRSARVDKYLASVPVPSGLDAAQYDRWYRATVKSIADGEYEPEKPAAIEGQKRDLRELAAPMRNLRDEYAEGRKRAQAPSKPTDPEHARRKAAALAELDAMRHKTTEPAEEAS